MELIENGIYSTTEGNIIVIPHNRKDAQDNFLYLEIAEELTSNGEINKYFFEILDLCEGKEFCSHIKCLPRYELEKLLDGYIGKLNCQIEYTIFWEHKMYTTKDGRTVCVEDSYSFMNGGLLDAFFMDKIYDSYEKAHEDLLKQINKRTIESTLISKQEFIDLIDENLVRYDIGFCRPVYYKRH